MFFWINKIYNAIIMLRDVKLQLIYFFVILPKYYDNNNIMKIIN